MSSEQQQEEQRMKKLEELSAHVKRLIAGIGAVHDLSGGKYKWEWQDKAMAIVKKLRKLGEDNRGEIRKKLDPLLEWPTKESSNPDGFYDKDPPFNRSKDWFKSMGFEKYQTAYTFASNWDAVEIMATFLVPDNLGSGDKCPVMWYFHGGGFCTGAGDHIPWYSKSSLEHAKRHKAMVIAPDYPLGPEGTCADIVISIREFLAFYRKDGCFEKGESHWTQWLIKKIGKDVSIEKNDVFLEGESAGGHAAVPAMFYNADIRGPTESRIHINATLLRYPMVAHYERDFPADGEGLMYMGHKVSYEDAKKQAEAIIEAVEELEKLGLAPTRTTGLAPQYMAPAFLLSTTKLWIPSLIRNHTEESSWLDMARFGSHLFEDCLSRPEFYHKQLDEMRLSPFILYHGYDDINCPYDDTEKFKALLIRYFPSRYIDNETVFLEKVTELTEKNGVKGNKSTAVGHGFDYALSEEQEPFLKRAYERVDRFWPVRK